MAGFVSQNGHSFEGVEVIHKAGAMGKPRIVLTYTSGHAEVLSGFKPDISRLQVLSLVEQHGLVL